MMSRQPSRLLSEQDNSLLDLRADRLLLSLERIKIRIENSGVLEHVGKEAVACRVLHQSIPKLTQSRWRWQYSCLLAAVTYGPALQSPA